MTDKPPPWRAAPGGVILAVRATPRAVRSAIAGPGEDSQGRAVLCVRIAAPPADGAANAALVDLLALVLGLRKRDVTIRSGGTTRTKQVHLSGDPKALIERLIALQAA